MSEATMIGSWLRGRHAPPVLPLLVAAAVCLFTVSLFAGPAGLGLPSSPAAAWVVFNEIRVPRAVLAVLVGGALGIAGAALQGYLRNPLAEPGVLGVTGGASLGAVIAIHTGLSASFALALPLGGLAGAFAATLAVLTLARSGSGTLGLILAGVAIASVCGALTTLALTLAPNPFASVEILFWTLGSLEDRSLLHVWLAAPLIIAGGAVLLRLGRALDALTLGEDAAQNLGVDLTRAKWLLLFGTALTVGASTSITGSIGFVGLVVPHLLRRWVSWRPSALLGASALGGAVLVLAADLAVRLLAPVADVRLGVLTALLGAPFFLWLVVRTERGNGAP